MTATSATAAPSPVLVAAAPALIAAIGQLQTFVNTVLTGDPTQLPLRASAAADIMIGNLKLLLPGLVVSEIGVVQTDINTKLTALQTSLQKLLPAPGAPPA